MAFPKVRRVEAPAVLPVPLAFVKDHLRVDHADEDALITAYLRASVSELDGRDGLFYCLSPQTWAQEVVFGPREIALPLGPVISITSVSYVDAEGEEATLDPALYQLIPASGTDDAVLECLSGAMWPIGCRGTITYRAGADEVDEAIQIALCMMVADKYRLRESQAREEPKANPTVERLLYRFNRRML